VSAAVVGWKCAPCGWATTDFDVMQQAVWRDGRDVSLICPNCYADGKFVDYYPKGTVMGDALEAIAAAVHEEWMATKRAGGVTTRCSESGEELMVPYADLSEGAKELDRGSVRAVFNAAETAGYKIVAS
jgi:hypothetical protein